MGLAKVGLRSCWGLVQPTVNLAEYPEAGLVRDSLKGFVKQREGGKTVQMMFRGGGAARLRPAQTSWDHPRRNIA